MKTLTSSTKTKASIAKGTFPIVIVEIQWEGGTKYYSEMDYTFEGNVCEVAIISLDDFVSSGKVGSKGEVSSVSFKLDDTSGFLKSKINSTIIEGTLCKVWHHYYDLGTSNATLMLYGRLAGPLSWNEGELTFSGQIETLQTTGEIGFAPAEYPTEPNYITDLLPEAYNTPWPIIFGSPKRVPIVKVIGPSLDHPGRGYTYVIGLYGINGVSKVLAKRQCYGDKEDDLYVVPIGDYNVGEASIGGRTVPTLTMEKLLSENEDEQWSDDLYVDVSSTLSSNIAEQIQWILESFTPLTADAASFAAAKTAVAETPAHFVLSDQQDALALCEKMAWQARCILFIKNGTAYLRTLFENGAVDATITPNEARLKSVALSFTQTEDIITVFNALWKQDYSGQKEGDQRTVFKNQVSRYGVIPQDYIFFCFTTLQSVQISASFWAYRYANSWREIKAECFLPMLSVEAYDCVQISHPTLSTHALRGFAKSVSHNIETSVITIEVELGSKAGDNTGGQPIEDPKYWSGGSENKDGYSTPTAARAEKLICESTLEKGLKDKLDKMRGTRIRIEAGSIAAGNAYEIYWIAKDVFITEDNEYGDVAHVGTPRSDNIEPGQILFTKEATTGYYGYGYPAGEDVWVDYNLNPDSHPNYFDSPITKIGDNVGVKSGFQYLSKDRSGFVVTGMANGKVTVSSGSIDPKLEPIRSSDTIGAYSPAEIYGYADGKTLVRKPTEDNLPPGRIIFPNIPMTANSDGKGYNAFDVSPYITGGAPSAIGVEFGTVAGSTELAEGNTGFVVLGRKDGRNQFRPF
jgi:hypothetical protein